MSSDGGNDGLGSSGEGAWHEGSRHDGSRHDGSGGDGSPGGTPVPHSRWLVDYEGEGRYFIHRLSDDGTIDEYIRPDRRSAAMSSLVEGFPLLCTLVHAEVYALPGDTIVLSPAAALLFALEHDRAMLDAIPACAIRMPRRKACPAPILLTPDGIGIRKGGHHPDQHAAFTSAIVANALNLGAHGLRCGGTKRRWEWRGPEEGRDGGGGPAGN